VGGGKLALNSAHLAGNVGLGPGSTSTLEKTDVTGTFYADATAQLDTKHFGRNFTVTGGLVQQSLSQAQSDADAASSAYAALAPTQSLGKLNKSATVMGDGGTNVIAVNSVDYNGKTLTLTGSANDYFIFNVSGNFHFHQSTIALAGNVTANHVLFNFATPGTTVELSKPGSVVNGTFLAPWGSVEYHDPASFTGAVIAQNINIHSNANLVAALFTPPQPATASLSGSVLNQSGVPESGVTLTLTNTSTAQQFTAETGADGQYSITGVPAGTYNLVESTFLTTTSATAGTDNGQPDGTVVSPTEIDAIGLNGGDSAINYNFSVFQQIIG
jgi:hypothetical protein